jgi:hypothetical protein
MSLYPRVRTSGQAWFVMLFFAYYFWKHWDNPWIRAWAYFYGGSMLIALIWIVVQIIRDNKELKRQTASGELWHIKTPPKV